MDILETVSAMRSASRAAKARGQRVALVPTMGYLHEGHLELVRRARERAGWVAVSIFVNPTQFGPGEDLSRYPRDFGRDRGLCEAAGVDALFFPPVGEMYPPGYQTYVTVEEIAGPLCGSSRPGHFRGVATVVAKLFLAAEPDVAVFGEKDYQQLQVIRRMVRDLGLPVEILGVPTVREADGLAMSSRNKYLSADERRRALCLSRALDEAEARVAAGERGARELLEAVRGILAEAGAEIDYAELRDAEALSPIEHLRGPAVLALAARFGTTRLIDNRVLKPA